MNLYTVHILSSVEINTGSSVDQNRYAHERQETRRDIGSSPFIYPWQTCTRDKEMRREETVTYLAHQTDMHKRDKRWDETWSRDKRQTGNTEIERDRKKKHDKYRRPMISQPPQPKTTYNIANSRNQLREPTKRTDLENQITKQSTRVIWYYPNTTQITNTQITNNIGSTT